MRTNTIKEKEQIESIIKECDTCFVGISDDNGVPYVLPMNFGYQDGVIYLHSAQEGKSISLIEKNPNVCITFCNQTKLVWQNLEVACSYRMRAGSVICHGRVVFEEDYDEKVKALDITMKQYSDREFTYSSPAIVNVKIWKVAIEKATAKEFGAPVEKPAIL